MAPFKPLAVVPMVCLGLTATIAFAADSDPGEFSYRLTLPLDAGQRETLRQLSETDPEARSLRQAMEEEARGRFELRPQPLEIIHYEGLLNTDPRRIASVSKLQQMDDIALLHQFWQVNEDVLSAGILRSVILAWAETYRPDGNDVNENKLTPVFNAFHGLRDTFTNGDRETVDAWIEDFGRLHLLAVRREEAHFTNRYTKHLRLLAGFAAILDREDWLETVADGVRRYVEHGLRPDGTSLDLEMRDTLNYHISALRPVIDTVLMLGPHGTGLYEWVSTEGASIRQSVHYVIPYALGEETREEWRHTRVELDRRRAAAGIAAYEAGRLFDPARALPLMEEASVFDSLLWPVTLQLHESDAARFASWEMVMREAARHP